MAERAETIQHDLDSEIVLTHVLTSKRLLKLKKTDAFTLYHYYALLAKMQQTNQIKATQSYCMKELGWGKPRFQAAKAELLQLKIAETIRKQDNKGHYHYYVGIHYLKNPVGIVSTPQENPPAGISTRNALELNTNVFNNYNALDTSTNVEGGVGKKQPTCPLLNGSALKAKYPNGHKECTEYLISVEESRGYPFTNKPKQYMFLHKILRSGIGFDQIDKVTGKIERRYGQGQYDFATIASWLDKGGLYGKEK